jgi:subtilisin family serine protease
LRPERGIDTDFAIADDLSTAAGFGVEREMMRRSRARLVLGVGAILLALVLGSSAGARALPASIADESFEAWFVELERGGATDRAAFFKHARDQGLDLKQRHVFDRLWNGVSVDVPAEQAGSLATVPGVQAVYPVAPISLPATDVSGSADPDLRYATSLTGADVAQNELDLDGSGVKVAIVDSGLDYTLPEFGACARIGPPCRVAGGYDFVGDDFNANPPDATYQPIPHPDDDPAPCDPNVADQRAGSSAAAHGTHVAGIVGADGRTDPDNLVTGVAPAATLYAYRVFGCNGSTSSDVMLAAMERAAADDVDVLNISIGAALSNFPNYPTAQAADELVESGTIVVASIGNSGELGLFAASAPGVADKVMGVASVDNVRTFLPYFTISTDAQHVGYNAAAGAPDPPTEGTFPVARTGTRDAANGACTGTSIGDLTGKVALIRRGGCPFTEKANNAENAGAVAVVFYNSMSGRVSPTVVGAAPPITIPVVSITKADGETLWDRAASGSATLTWTAASEFFDNTDTPGRASSFSSWGSASDLTLKPDIAAPGGNIRSTWPHQQHGGHWVIGGTSMAAPHVAGAVALYLQAHPGTSPAAVRTALQNSADPVRFMTTTFADSTARQGAGLLDVIGAVQATTVVSPAKISFGDGVVRSATLTIMNNGTASKTYNLSSIPTITPAPSATTQYPFTFGIGVGPAATFGGVTSVTVAPGASTTITATVNATALPERALYGGYVVLTPSGGGPVLRVPYLGLRGLGANGDYQGIQALGNAGCAMPLLARFGAASDKIECATPARTIDGMVAAPRGGAWTQPKKDPVILLYHLDHQAANVTVTLLRATGEEMRQGNRSPVLQSVDLHPRNSAATTFFGFVWDGTQAISQRDSTSRKATPAGTYKLRITLTKVKALNDTRPAGTETWMSPPITLRDG